LKTKKCGYNAITGVSWKKGKTGAEAVSASAKTLAHLCYGLRSFALNVDQLNLAFSGHFVRCKAGEVNFGNSERHSGHPMTQCSDVSHHPIETLPN